MMTATRKQLPPYGRALLDLRRRRQVPGGPLVISCGRHAWVLGKAYWRLVVPDDQEPAVLDFSIVAGLHVWVAHGGDVVGERFDRIVKAITDARPASLIHLNLDPTIPKDMPLPYDPIIVPVRAA